MENNYHFYPFTPFEIATRNAKEEQVKLSGGDYIVDKGRVINKKAVQNGQRTGTQRVISFT